MRRAAALLSLLLLLAAWPATAQPPTYSEPFQVRAAVGDIPSTTATEGAGWNIDQRYTIDFVTGGAQRDVTFGLSPGSTLVNASCTCGLSPTTSGSSVTFQFMPSTPSGSYTMDVLATQPASSAFGLEVVRPEGSGAGVVVLYVPVGREAEAAIEPTQTLPSTSGAATITEFRAVSFPAPFWAAIHPATAAGGEAPPQTQPWNDDMVWVFLALGIVAGAVLWAVLVSRGVVQRKGRRQVVATAAHVEAAANEPAPVLEGRKRALLAALKEIEVAKMNNEMPTEVYDAVKADLKKQAVTVMRALETATAASESKAS